MKIWITRPSLWDCIVKGIGRCSIWLVKPQFDMTPRGVGDGDFANEPIGWRALDDDGQPLHASQIGCRVGSKLRKYEDLVWKLFSAMSVSIDGNPKPDDNDCYDRWSRLKDDPLFDDAGQRTFCLELDVPPQLWLDILKAISQQAIDDACYARLLMESDLPF